MGIDFAKTSDIEEILALQPQVYSIDNLPKNAHKMFQDLIASPLADILVAKVSGKVVGCGTMFYLAIPAHGKQAAYLEGIVVDEKHRGKGAGTALAKKFIELAKEKGCYKIVFTSSDKRADVHKFYENLGFKKWGFEFRMDL